MPDEVEQLVSFPQSGAPSALPESPPARVLSAEQIIAAALVQKPEPAEVVALLVANGWTPPNAPGRARTGPATRKEAIVAVVTAVAERWPDQTDPPLLQLAHLVVDALRPDLVRSADV